MESHNNKYGTTIYVISNNNATYTIETNTYTYDIFVPVVQVAIFGTAKVGQFCRAWPATQAFSL